MDPWKEYAALHDCREALRAWAELEGKSTTMSEDLYRLRSAGQRRRNAWAALGCLAHVGVWLLETLRIFRSG